MSDGRTRIAVLAPSPILTVTIEQSDAEPELHLHPGGQGYWVARMLTAMDVDVAFCAPLGGEIGTVLAALLDKVGLDLRMVTTAGWNGSYVHRRGGDVLTRIAEVPSPALSRHEADDLYSAIVSAALEADLTALTGTRGEHVLEPGFYGRLASDLRANGNRLTADLSGAPLSDALGGGVDLLHVGERELRDHAGAALADPASLLAAARRLRADGAAELIVSRAAEPSLALLTEGAFEVVGPVFGAREHRGAGDSMFAAISAHLGRGEDTATAVRFGAAAGALNVIRRGLGSGSREEIERLARRVELRPWPA